MLNFDKFNSQMTLNWISSQKEALLVLILIILQKFVGIYFDYTMQFSDYSMHRGKRIHLCYLQPFIFCIGRQKIIQLISIQFFV